MKIYKYIIAIAVFFLGVSFVTATTLGIQGGGTASTTLTGILTGNGLSPIQTLIIGSGLTYSGNTLNSTGGGGGSGTVSTSTHEIAGQIPYWTTTSGTPALLGQIATSTLTPSSPLTGSFTVLGNGSVGCQTASGSQAGCLASADWTTFNNKQASGNYITALTGDVTASGPGSVASTLATVNTNTGSWGSSTAIPNFTVNGKGLITAAGTSVVIAPAGTLSGTTLNSTVVSSSLTSLGTITTGVWNGTAIANANLANSSVTVNTTAPLSGGGAVSLGSALTLTCPTCLTVSPFGYPFTTATNYGVTVQATTTPLELTGGFFSSTTSVIASTTFAQNGDVAIGAPTDNVPLFVFSSSTANAAGQDTLQVGSAITSGTVGSGPAIDFGNGTTIAKNFKIVDGADGSGGGNSNLIFSSLSGATQEDFRLMYNGQIGISSSTPWGTLSVNPNNSNNGANGGPEFVVGSSTQTSFVVANNNNVGVATTTPGTRFSVGGIANFNTSTSTFVSTGGLNITGGCFSINGTCVGGSGGGSGTVTTLTAGTNVTFSSGATCTTTCTINASGGGGLTGTTGQVPYFSSTNTAVGTSSLFVTTAGNVTVGTTTSAGSSLYVSGLGSDISTTAFEVTEANGYPIMTLKDDGTEYIGGQYAQMTINSNGVMNSNLTANFNGSNSSNGGTFTNYNNTAGSVLNVYGGSGSTQNILTVNNANGSNFGLEVDAWGRTFMGNQTSIGSTTPWGMLSIATTTTVLNTQPFFVIASSTSGKAGTTTAFKIDSQGREGCGYTCGVVKLASGIATIATLNGVSIDSNTLITLTNQTSSCTGFPEISATTTSSFSITSTVLTDACIVGWRLEEMGN